MTHYITHKKKIEFGPFVDFFRCQELLTGNSSRFDDISSGKFVPTPVSNRNFMDAPFL